MAVKKLGLEPWTDETAIVTASTLGRYTEVAARTRIAESVVGDYSYLMQDCDAWCTTIGKFSNIASNVRMNATNHPMDRASQHHFTYRAADYWPDADMDEAFFEWRRDNAVTVGHDTWLGHGSTIMPGVTVGDGAVVGSGAVVTKDVAPYTIVAGVAAKPIRQRFVLAIAERMQALAWWDWDHAKLGQALPDFRALSAEAFLEKYEI
ncbi:MAG: DapH/DapD/GlmU-related protein [Pseudomonadota bacterium]